MKPKYTVLRRFTTTLIRVGFVLCLSSATLLGQSPMAVTASGKTVIVAPGERPPWMGDIIHTAPMEYPYRDRMRNNQGSGLFRVTLDPGTGLVTNMAVRQSVGYTTLDDSAISAFRQLRVKPRKWKQLDIAVRFEMARSREEAMEKMRRRQATKPR